jgi:gamma-butyrobetaine dioxygenase
MNDRSDSAMIGIGAIEALFTSSEGMAYLGEDVTMIQHQLQAGAHAIAAGVPDSLVVAALLHDVGHMVGQLVGEQDASVALADDLDAHHDSSGARWLVQWFGADVTEPVRLHVAAKRYLVAIEADYAAKLSAASVHTLRLQGGPMNAEEVAAFEALPHHRDAVALRRFDEAAKDPDVDAPSLAAHRALIARVLRATP